VHVGGAGAYKDGAPFSVGSASGLPLCRRVGWLAAFLLLGGQAPRELVPNSLCQLTIFDL